MTSNYTQKEILEAFREDMWSGGVGRAAASPEEPFEWRMLMESARQFRKHADMLRRGMKGANLPTSFPPWYLKL